MSEKRHGRPVFVNYSPPPDGRVPLGPDGLPDLPLDDALIEAARGSGQHRHVLGPVNTVVRSMACSGVVLTPVARLTVDVERRTVTLDGETYDVASVQALRWVRVLAARPGVWVSSSDLGKHDSELTGAIPHRLKKKLPKAVRELIVSQEGAGSRITLS